MITHHLGLKRGRPFWIAAVLLAGMSGGLLALGCEPRDESADEAQVKDAAAIEREVADLEKQLVDADRGAKREIAQARKNSQKMPVASREALADAIERTEDARDEASDRLAELKKADAVHWDQRRARVVEALEELADARHDVVASLAGGQPSLSDG